ncbi:MAG: glycosyltransferase family 2 protein [Clostridia bacterium]|nr:glycosyltransferase family 2 protein [Clostridia bacterium]
MEIVKTILKVIYYMIDIAVIIYMSYYVITGLFVFINNKKRKIKNYRAKHKLAVVVAARNEGKVIGHLIDSLKKQNYPKNLYDIFIVPNNCTDNTKEIAEKYGAHIIECQGNVASKGEALKYAFKFINQNFLEFDAYCVFDADNIVHPNFLRRMNDALCSGFHVAQGYRDSKNPSDTWISSCYSLFYWTQNFFFNQARHNMGWSASINGTGFMVTRELIQKNGFNTITLTEDIEFAAQCALNNEKIAFVKDAITYDEQPLDFSQSWKQRKRWSIGTMQCCKYYSTKLMKVAFKSKVPQAFDMSLFFIAPFIQILGLLVFIILLIYNIFDIQVYDISRFLYDYNIFSLALVYIATIVISAFVVLVEKKKVKRAFKGILTIAIFMLSWIPIHILCLIKRNKIWEPIEHSRTINIDSIIDMNVK